jgi:hypothetical protein
MRNIKPAGEWVNIQRKGTITLDKVIVPSAKESEVVAKGSFAV